MFFLRGEHLAGIRALLKSIGAIRIPTCKISTGGAARRGDNPCRNEGRRNEGSNEGLHCNYDLYFPLCATNGSECEIMRDLPGERWVPL